MFKKVLVGHDLGQGGDDALALGCRLADGTGAKLVVAGALPIAAMPAELERRAEAVGAEAEVTVASSPARGLHELASELGADLIVVGSSRHGRLGHVLAGDVGLSLLTDAACAVAVAPKGFQRGSEAPLSRLVVGYDGSDESRVALDGAVELSEVMGVDLKLVAVAEPPDLLSTMGTIENLREHTAAAQAHARAILDEALKAIPSEIRAEASLLTGDPAQLLAKACTQRTLLLLGSRGYGSVRRVLLGSVSAPIVRLAPCPVLVHPRGAGSEDSKGPALAQTGTTS